MVLRRIRMCCSLMYHSLRVSLQIIYGAWKVSKLPHPIVSIFGSAKMLQGDKYAQDANQVASLLVEQGISVLTGGGPGIMEAANCGAMHKKKIKDKIMSIGIGVTGLHEPKNVCVEEYF